MQPEAILERFSGEIDVGINHALSSIHPDIANIARYFLGWLDQSFQPALQRSGKKLRPTLALLVHEAISDSAAPVLPFAVALELIHNYSLIHDDIEDRDVERRGRPTVWKLWGENIAINVGDTLHALAFHALLGTVHPATYRILDIHRALVETSCRLCDGQHLDMSFEKTVNIDDVAYVHMITGKTAALLACATFGAARLATDDQRIVTAFQNFGMSLGLGFQIRDDFLNLWGDQERVGKGQYSDLRSKKKTLPVVYALSMLKDDRGERLRSIYTDSEPEMKPEDIRHVLEVLTDLGAKEYTAALVNRYTLEALAWLEQTGISNASQRQLVTLTKFLGGRDY